MIWILYQLAKILFKPKILIVTGLFFGVLHLTGIYPFPVFVADTVLLIGDIIAWASNKILESIAQHLQDSFSL